MPRSYDYSGEWVPKGWEIMMKLAGKPMIARILEREALQEINDIVLAIPNTVADGVLAEIVRNIVYQL